MFQPALEEKRPEVPEVKEEQKLLKVNEKPFTFAPRKDSFSSTVSQKSTTTEDRSQPRTPRAEIKKPFSKKIKKPTEKLNIDYSAVLQNSPLKQLKQKKPVKKTPKVENEKSRN